MGLGFFECPSSLFIIMGVFTNLAMVATYFLSQRYASPEIVIVGVTAVGTGVFVIGTTIVQSFQRVAEASIMKTEFVSIASHQLRAPLTAAKWSIDLLLSGRPNPAPPEIQEALLRLLENNERMTKLVNELLNVSRIEQGRLALRAESLDIQKIVAKIIREVSAYAEKARIKLIVDSPSSFPLFFADERYISMVVENLIDNAIRYSNEGGKVTVRFSQTGSAGRVEITDEGVGIPKEQQKYIFKKFFRSSNALRHQTTGTGLGLFIAHAVITGSGGRIGFSSRENKGSTFWFELPIVKE